VFKKRRFALFSDFVEEVAPTGSLMKTDVGIVGAPIVSSPVKSYHCYRGPRRRRHNPTSHSWSPMARAPSAQYCLPLKRQSKAQSRRFAYRASKQTTQFSNGESWIACESNGRSNGQVEHTFYLLLTTSGCIPSFSQRSKFRLDIGWNALTGFAQVTAGHILCCLINA
jgi:hypothetical protein